MSKKKKSKSWTEITIALLIALVIVSLVVALCVGLNYLVAWAILECLVTLGAMTTYTGGQIWAATGLLTVVSMIFGGKARS